ncbi:MAG: hypothetical protein AB8G11_06585, partial [Saprospiraceae bacterium]
MKQLITLIIVLFFNLTGFSQTVYLLDSTHNLTLDFFGWDNLVNKKYTYDSLGTLISHREDDGTINNNFFYVGQLLEYSYTYNNANQLTLVEDDLSYEGNWNRTLKTYSHYTNSGKISSDTTYYYIASVPNGAVLSYNVYTYDTNNRLQTWVDKDANEDAIRRTYAYNGNTAEINTITLENYTSSSWNLYTTEYFTYNAQGQKIEWLNDYYDASGQVEYKRSEDYTYDTNGDLIGIFQRDWDMTWTDSHRTRLDYTATGKINKTAIDIYYLSNSIWEWYDSIQYHYDMNDNLIEKFRYENSAFDIGDTEDYYYYIEVNLTNTEKILLDNNIKITPNPYRTFTPLNIQGLDDFQTIQLQVRDLQGRMLFN